MLPETRMAGALLLAERIREEIERSSQFQCPMTVSIGAANLAEDTEDMAQFFKECDAALYQAKEHGRNRVSWVGEQLADTSQGIGIKA